MRPLVDLLRGVDLIVGVGGGYLRARNCAEVAKLEAGHLLQMRATRIAGTPAVYLPQSVGPAMPAWPLASHLSGLLAGASSVFVRDDRSARFLACNGNTQRAPDLAVLDFERRSAEILQHAGREPVRVRRVAFVLRQAPSWSATQRDRYETSTRRLIESLSDQCEIMYAVQSTGRGNDDVAYYRSIGIDAPLLPLKEVLAGDPPDVVVSVRLHGALESILHGVPAYHLSYERKGFGAYADLGVEDWVANAADFCAEAVARILLAPGAVEQFWFRARYGLDAIRIGRERVIAGLRAARKS